MSVSKFGIITDQGWTPAPPWFEKRFFAAKPRKDGTPDRRTREGKALLRIELEVVKTGRFSGPNPGA